MGIEWGMNKGKMTSLSMFEDAKRVPGDYNYDPMGMMEEGDPNEYALKEITHGRLDDRLLGHDPAEPHHRRRPLRPLPLSKHQAASFVRFGMRFGMRFGFGCWLLVSI